MLVASSAARAQTPPANYPYFNVKDFGAQGGTGAVNDAPAIQSAISAAASSGGIVYFPPGKYRIESTIVLPNWVALRGAGRASEIFADPGFAQQQMFYAHNGAQSMFYSRLDDLSLNANDVEGIVAVVIADAWQETSGASRLVIQKFRDRGIIIRFGYGGASWTKLSEIELFGSAFGSNIGIECQQIGSVGAFMLNVNAISICGGASHPMSVGITMANDCLIADTVHFEYCNYGIDLGGVGNSSLRGVTGSFNGVGELITLQSNYHGSAVLQAISPNGAAATFHDYGNGTVITTRIPHRVIQK
jgi:hypothetical protein